MAETMGFDDEGTRRAHNEVYAQCLENMMGNVQFSNGEDHAIAAAISALRRPNGYRYPLPSEDKALLQAAELVMGVRSDGWVQIMSMLCARVRDYAERDARRVSLPKLETDPAAEKPPYVPPKPTKRLTKNAARCTVCKTVIQSKHRHDWVSCKCGKIFVDGGLAYQRIGYSVPEDFEDLSEWAPIEPEPEKP